MVARSFMVLPPEVVSAAQEPLHRPPRPVSVAATVRGSSRWSYSSLLHRPPRPVSVAASSRVSHGGSSASTPSPATTAGLRCSLWPSPCSRQCLKPFTGHHDRSPLQLPGVSTYTPPRSTPFTGHHGRSPLQRCLQVRPGNRRAAFTGHHGRSPLQHGPNLRRVREPDRPSPATTAGLRCSSRRSPRRCRGRSCTFTGHHGRSPLQLDLRRGRQGVRPVPSPATTAGLCCSPVRRAYRLKGEGRPSPATTAGLRCSNLPSWSERTRPSAFTGHHGRSPLQPPHAARTSQNTAVPSPATTASLRCSDVDGYVTGNYNAATFTGHHGRSPLQRTAAVGSTKPPRSA